MRRLALIVIMVMGLAACDLDGHQCHEDEAVVVVTHTWSKAGNNRHDTFEGYLACVPVDDLRPIERSK